MVKHIDAHDVSLCRIILDFLHGIYTHVDDVVQIQTVYLSSQSKRGSPVPKTGYLEHVVKDLGNA